MAASPTAARRASSEKVPAGPRNAIRMAIGAEGYGGPSRAEPAAGLTEGELVGESVVGGDRLARNRRGGDLEGQLGVSGRRRPDGQLGGLNRAGGNRADRPRSLDR